jgi:pilus assembly protein Flp/PilA
VAAPVLYNKYPVIGWSHFVLEDAMKDQLWKLSIKIQNIFDREEGQDLIEYALVVALIALVVTSGISSVATSLNNAFTAIGTKLTTATA